MHGRTVACLLQEADLRVQDGTQEARESLTIRQDWQVGTWTHDKLRISVQIRQDWQIVIWTKTGTLTWKTIVDYCLSIAKQGKQTAIPVCSKQMKFCRFRFSFAANKRKLPFFVSSVLCVSVYTVHILKRHGIHLAAQNSTNKETARHHCSRDGYVYM